VRIRPLWRDPRSVRGGRSDYFELSLRIRSAGLLARRTAYYIAKFILTQATFAAGWVAFVLIGPSWWQLITASVLGVLSTEIAFLGHDLGHQQVARTRRSSYLLSRGAARQPRRRAEHGMVAGQAHADDLRRPETDEGSEQHRRLKVPRKAS